MRAYLGTIGLCAAASAITVLFAVTNVPDVNSRTSAGIGGNSLVAEPANSLPGAAGNRSAIPSAAAPDLFAEHPYPDHP